MRKNVYFIVLFFLLLGCNKSKNLKINFKEIISKSISSGKTISEIDSIYKRVWKKSPLILVNQFVIANGDSSYFFKYLNDSKRFEGVVFSKKMYQQVGFLNNNTSSDRIVKTLLVGDINKSELFQLSICFFNRFHAIIELKHSVIKKEIYSELDKWYKKDGKFKEIIKIKRNTLKDLDNHNGWTFDILTTKDIIIYNKSKMIINDLYYYKIDNEGVYEEDKKGNNNF